MTFTFFFSSSEKKMVDCKELTIQHDVLAPEPTDKSTVLVTLQNNMCFPHGFRQDM